MTTEKTVEITGLDPITGHGSVRIGDDWRTLPFSAPGDIARDDGDGGLRLASPASPQRTDPICPHFGSCGGCQLQHLQDRTVADWKRLVVVEALKRQGIEAQVDATLTVPMDSRRRAKFTLQRTKKTSLFGFRAQGEHRVIDLETCPVLVPALDAARDSLREIAMLGAPRKRPVTVHATITDSGLDIALEDAKELDLPLREKLSTATEAADIARLVWNGDVVIERRRPVLTVGSAKLHPPPLSFLQATRETEAILSYLLKETLRDSGTIADLFCGCGTFSLPMAHLAPVTAIDGDADMVAALAEAAQGSNAPHRIETDTRDLFRRPLLPHELDRFDAVVFDPPRAGAKFQSEQIALSKVPLVVGISCNPVTFARDAALLLKGGYRLGRIIPLDQFRFSPHTEVVGVFRRPV